MDDAHDLDAAPPPELIRSEHVGVYRAAMALLAMALLYGAIYFPYPSHSWPVAVLFKILECVAALSAAVIRLWEPGIAVVAGPTLTGRFPMQIVLDCAALDVQALYLAAVLVFPTTLRKKLWGAGLGLAFLAAANIARIVLLYFVGAYAPAYFDLVHEDLLAFVMVALTGAAYLVWIYSIQRVRTAGLASR